MKVSCTKENLNRGLGIVSHMVGTRTTLPVLNNILLKTEKGRLKLSATDLEIGISTWIGAKVDADGAITIPARLIAEFTSTNTDKTIILELKDTTLNLKSEHFKANIKGIEASEFPLIPEVKNETIIELKAAEFRDAIIKTVFAAAIDETRPVLAGIYIVVKDGKLKMVSTDSYRLAEKTLNVLSASTKNASVKSMIVPARTMSEIGRLIDESIDKVEIKVGENQVEFKLGPTIVVSRLVEGSFPDYEQIIPKEIKTKAELNTAEFASAIKMASFFARESANNVKFILKKPGTIQVVAVSPQVGDNTSDLVANIEGDELEIAFNAKFIMDVLNVINAEKVDLELAGPLAAGLLRPATDKNYLYIIMPLRMDE